MAVHLRVKVSDPRTKCGASVTREPPSPGPVPPPGGLLGPLSAQPRFRAGTAHPAGMREGLWQGMGPGLLGPPPPPVFRSAAGWGLRHPQASREAAVRVSPAQGQAPGGAAGSPVPTATLLQMNTIYRKCNVTSPAPLSWC